MYGSAVITISDKGFAGQREDLSGPVVADTLAKAGFEVLYRSMVPDERELITKELIKCADELNIPLVVTTGGTGFAPRDITPEATMDAAERLTPGIPEAMRAKSLAITDRAMLSRAQAGIRGGTLMVNLPGSPKAARENLEAVVSSLEHGLEMLLAPSRDHD
jgi:molybdenum cofactor synthesis domain-containing protein